MNGGGELDTDEFLGFLVALGHRQRLRIIGELAEGRVHVSELARRLALSRPLLYLHLERLEKAGIVVGRLELSSSGKAMKYFELNPFDVHLNLETVLGVVDAGEPAGHEDAGRAPQDVKESGS